MMKRAGIFLIAVMGGIAPVLAQAQAEPEGIRRFVAVDNVCAWPNLTVLGDGTITAVIHNRPSHGGMEGELECWASADGEFWEKRSNLAIHKPNTVRMNAAAGLAKNGDLIVLCSGWTNEKQEGWPKATGKFRDAILRSWVLRSADGGRTWEQRDAFPAADEEWTEHIPFGDIWAGEDGLLHTSCYQGKKVIPSPVRKTKGWRSWHFSSADDGWTWEPVSVIGEIHNETDIFPLGGKNWLAAARITTMELIRSDDNGATWGEPVSVTERNEINGHLMRLADGRLLLSYGCRVKDEYGVKAKLSGDEGKTWGEALRLVHTLDTDCGYPSSVQRKDGKIVTAFYARGSESHHRYHMGTAVWDVPEVEK